MQLPEWWRQMHKKNLVTIWVSSKLYKWVRTSFFCHHDLVDIQRKRGHGSFASGSFNFFPFGKMEEGQRFKGPRVE
jgi:hypothetical protein